jgi:phosphoribosylformylglycinamidine cyclo-ligase
MIADDATRKGGLPLYCMDVLDVSSLGEKGSGTNNLLRDLILGLADAVRDADMALIGGETAELGVCVGSNNPDAVTKFNWAAFGINAMHPTKRITGETIEAGDVVIAFREQGFRSNGMSFVRRVFEQQFGKTWWLNPDATDSVIAAAVPSILYTRLLTKANGWHSPDFKPVVPIKALAHITGGGIPEKFGEDVLFRRGLSAELDNLFSPPTIMHQCAKWSGGSSREMYKIMNGGQGMLAVVAPRHVDALINLAGEEDKEAKVCGRVYRRQPVRPLLVIHSTFDNEIVEYEP